MGGVSWMTTMRDLVVYCRCDLLQRQAARSRLLRTRLPCCSWRRCCHQTETPSRPRRRVALPRMMRQTAFSWASPQQTTTVGDGWGSRRSSASRTCTGDSVSAACPAGTWPPSGWWTRHSYSTCRQVNETSPDDYIPTSLTQMSPCFARRMVQFL